MNLNEMVRFIYDEIEYINSEYNVSHFEFLSNPDNDDIIQKHAKEKNFQLLSLAEIKKTDIEEYQFLLDNIFWLDYKTIFQKIHTEYINNHHVYNKQLNLTPLFIKSKIETEYSFNQYDYRIHHDISRIKFKIIHEYDSSHFNLDITLNHHQIKTKDPDNMNRTELSLYNNYINNLQLSNCSIPITKKNIEKFISIFLDDINKYDLSNHSIISFLQKTSKKDILPLFLKEKYTKEKIENNFYPANIPEHKKSDNRTFFDYRQCYIRCLAEDLDKYNFNHMHISGNLNGIEIMINYIGIIKSNYFLDISENRIFMYNNGNMLGEWYNIEDEMNIKDNILTIIEKDFFNKIKENPEVEKETHEYLVEQLLPLVINQNIDIELPDLKNLSMIQILSNTFPVIFKNGDIILEKNIHFDDSLNLNDVPEYKSFIEKIKIQSEIQKDNNFIEANNKKRL